MLNGMVTDLLRDGKLKTTVTRAHEVAPLAEKVITLAKQGDLASYRKALTMVKVEDVAKKLFDDAEHRFGDRDGGYTRITRVGIRRGDAAEVALLEIV